jgi:photosystem II stability/assembly factor-like uncharacterized protein
MNKIIFLLTLTFVSLSIQAQQLHKPSAHEIISLPTWAQVMYSEHANVWEVDSLYNQFYRVHPFQKSYHTQYYKRWRKYVAASINEQGFFEEKALKQATNSLREGNWSPVGPFQTSEGNGQQGSGQANIYCVAESKSNPMVLFCGTEPGEVFKSIDGGVHWEPVSLNIDFGSGVTSIAIDPSQENKVIAGSDRGLFLSNDGGATWTQVLTNTSLSVNEILFSTSISGRVFAATDKGLFLSTDGGETWVIQWTQKTYDFKENPSNANKLYALRNNPSEKICEFYSSTDTGNSWQIQTNGWYSSSHSAKNDGGGRLAVSAANPNRVYAYLIGESKTNDHGFIGVYRSDDEGTNWILPNGPVGGPYTESHPNLAIGYVGWDYHQGFYNCALMCSPTNADEILIGGLNLWRSRDGGLTFEAVSGYVGGPLNIHVDMQDFRVGHQKTWVTTDGGIYESADFFNTQPTFRMNGVRASDYWGFGTGWNEDVLIGGLYHNGNLVYHENYPAGNFLELGGGENPTGYVNPGNNRKVYCSDIGGRIIPQTYTGNVQSFGVGMFPNESYWPAESSEMEFFPNCYNCVLLGYENKIWKSIDGGSSYSLLQTFGTNVNHGMKYIEFAGKNDQIIYATQQTGTNPGKLWKTTNGGESWIQLNLPAGNSRRMLISADASNENVLFLAFPDGANTSKMFKTTDGGTTWTNISNVLLNNQSIQSILAIPNAQGGVYAGTNTNVYYYNNDGWIEFSGNLPLISNTNILKPFYKDSKIRMATYGKGIWESNLVEAPQQPIARIMADKLSFTYTCQVDSFYFDDYSIAVGNSIQRTWTFPTGSPSTSSLRNPAVFFQQEGQHLAILEITDENGLTDKDTLIVQVQQATLYNALQEGFENAFLPENWTSNYESGSTTWAQFNTGAYNQSLFSARCNHYDHDANGAKGAIEVTFSSNGMLQDTLSFDVAYAPYGGQYSDTLEVWIQVACDENPVLLYRKGGTTLQTTAATPDLFVPTATQWRTEKISLAEYMNQDQLKLSFASIGRWGNCIYLDNVNLASTASVNQLKPSNISVYPNPICKGESITISHPNFEKVRLFDAKGKMVHLWNTTKNPLPLPHQLNAGMYLLEIQGIDFLNRIPIIIND